MPQPRLLPDHHPQMPSCSSLRRQHARACTGEQRGLAAGFLQNPSQNVSSFFL